jgi:hypothetical protein
VSVITFARAPVNPREHPQSGTTAR